MKSFFKGLFILILLGVMVWGSFFLLKERFKIQYQPQYDGVSTRITWECVNFRAEPGFDTNVKRTLYCGTTVTMTGRAKDTSWDDIAFWYEVKTATGETGWIISNAIGMNEF